MKCRIVLSVQLAYQLRLLIRSNLTTDGHLAQFCRAVPKPSTARAKCCRKFTTSGSWKDYSVPFSGRSISVQECSHQHREGQRWEDSSELWDHRKDKRSAQQTNFHQKGSQELLWVNHGCKPFPVYPGRVTLSPQLKTIQGVQFRRLCDQGPVDRALDVLVHMDQQGTVPSVEMYRLLLKACIKRRALVQAKLVYTHLAKHGLESATSLGEDVVSTLVKCGGLKEALYIFYRLPYRNVFCWTAIISGFANAGQGREALRTYDQMQEEDVLPNTYTFVSLLKACAAIIDLKEGKRVHAEVLRYRCESDLFVGTSLVDMYRKCGSIVDAQNVFDRLSERNVVLWTAMLAAYVEQGQGEKALRLYGQMQREGVSPDGHTYVSVLQACGMLAEKDDSGEGCSTKLKWLDKGRAVHADSRKKGYHLNVFVGSTLVRMYEKCGSVTDAQNAFNELTKPDVVSWNAMLDAYVNDDQGEKALRLYEKLRKEGLSPNEHTLHIALQACSMVAEKKPDFLSDGQSDCLQMGKIIHADALKWGCGSDVFVASGLINMYRKFGSVVDAQNVFDSLSHRDVVLWNSMLAAYARQGQADKVLQLYIQMQQEGTSPDGWTFVSALQSGGILAEQEQDAIVDGQSTKVQSLGRGKEMHAEVWRKGYDSDVFVGNALISMYAKCGSQLSAQSVFDDLPQRNVVSWNAMLAAYVDHGHAEQVLQLHEQMHKEGVTATNRTFVSVLQACGMLAEGEDSLLVEGRSAKAKCLEMGKALQAEAYRQGHHSDVFVGNSLVSLYGKCGSIQDARSVFDGLSDRNIVTWNAMLATCIQHGEEEKAMQLYIQMQQGGVPSPDARTCVSALQACSLLAAKEVDTLVHGVCMKLDSLQRGKAIHADFCMRGYNMDVFIASTLICMYGKCGSLSDAVGVYDVLPQSDVVVSTAMLSAFVQQGQADEALELYRELQQGGIILDEITLVCILQACSSTGSLRIVRQVHNTLLGTGDYLTPLVVNTLISAYGRCASLVDAQCLFDSLPQPDVKSWTALIAAYAWQGDCEASLKCFEKMQLADVKPDNVTFLALISACSHAGLVDKGFEYFEAMTKNHGITPELEHYVSMVDLFGRAGCFTRVEHLLSTMPMPPSFELWLCLMGACRMHNNVSLGEQAFNCAVRLQPNHASAHTLMSNMYADAGLLDLGKKVRQMGVACKKPGQTWIEHEQDVHTFSVGDRKHTKNILHHAIGMR